MAANIGGFSRRSGWRVACALLVVSVLALAGAEGASAIEAPETFNVTRFDDPMGGSCVPASCSLRQAITAVNGRVAQDTIEIPAGTVVLDPALLALTITRSNFTIDGAGARATAISGADGTRVLSIAFPVTGAPVTLQNLAVVHGHVNGDGAGIGVTAGRLALDRVALTDNHGLADGGGLAVDGGAAVTVAHSTIAHNSATGNGGGIQVTGSTGAPGGGSTLAVTDSTITANTATLGGGVIVTAGTPNSHPAATLTNVTLAANGAAAGGDLERLTGAGTESGALSVADTIIADAARGGNCDGGETDGGHNIDSAGDCGLDLFGTSLIGVDPLIGPLDDNGGPTDTHLLRAGSPAIDGGAGCATALDQRGVDRAAGAHHTGGACDIGAYEAIQTTDLAIANTGTPASVAPGSNVTYTLTVTSPALSPAESNEAAEPVVQDTLPAGTTLVSAAPSQGSCSGTATVTCNLGHVADGASAQITLIVTTGPAMTINDTATVSSARIDVNPADDTATASTTVMAPTGDGGNQPPPVNPPIAAAFTGRLSLNPTSFRAASSGPSAARATGTTVSYTLTQPATVTFTVKQPRTGRRVGKRCAKPTKSNRKKRRCVRLVGNKRFSWPSNLGVNSFHFSGRVKGKKLPPGRYKLIGAIAGAGKRPAPVTASFRIKK